MCGSIIECLDYNCVSPPSCCFRDSDTQNLLIEKPETFCVCMWSCTSRTLALVSRFSSGLNFWRQGQLRLVSIWLTLDVFLCRSRQNLVSVPPKTESCFCTPQDRILFLYPPRQNLVSVPPKTESCFCTPQDRILFLYPPRQNLVSVPPKTESCFCTPWGRLLLHATVQSPPWQGPFLRWGHAHS